MKVFCHLRENDSYFSAGVGKTACFIAIDSMLQRIDNDNTVDIYGYVTMMRSQRNFMIQNDVSSMLNCVHIALFSRRMLS